jgi:putative transposase
MRWLETDPMNERKRFILEATGGLFSHSELCLRHDISRKTGYKWPDRYEVEGPDGLGDHSRRPCAHPHTTDPHVLAAAFEIHRRRCRWGADKIRARLLTLHPDWRVPSTRVLHKYFLREGLVKKPRRSRRRPHPGRPTAPFDAPNAIWSADFKGQFKTLDGRYCYPLTVQDGFSRYLLACQGLDGTTYAGSRRVFTRLFREFGLPERIRTDNGSPSASMALGRLSRLSVWWIKLAVSCPISSSPLRLSRTAAMSACTKTSMPTPPSHLLGREYIGLEEIADGIWAIYFGSVSLGWLHIDRGAILDHDGSSSRNPKL